jgi:hypothetical protein
MDMIAQIRRFDRQFILRKNGRLFRPCGPNSYHQSYAWAYYQYAVLKISIIPDLALFVRPLRILGVTSLFAPSASPSLGGERRTAGRYPVNVSLNYRMLHNGAVVDGTGWLENMSSSGFLLQTLNPLPTGVQIEISVPWPGHFQKDISVNLWARGRVVRTQDGGAAIRIMQYEYRTYGQ